MPAPRVVAVTPGSPAESAQLLVGDEILAVNGRVPRDVIQYRLLTDDADPVVDIGRGGLSLSIEVSKAPGVPLGVEVESAVFDRVRTCDNHCEFCFIYQLPKGMRKSLYLKDDDYRLSFLYGNFTTLTRFTEADLERVVTEGLSPLHVSIHATDPAARADMLRNPRGAVSLRWLRALLDHGIEVHGQVVVCPGLNDGAVLEDTLCGVLDQYPELASLCVVPLGVSRYTTEARMRPHTTAEADLVLDLVEQWQGIFLGVLGRRLVFAADEYYLLTGHPFPAAEAYEGFGMHEDGIGMARAFADEFTGRSQAHTAPVAGFFAAVDGAPADGYRAPRLAAPHPDIAPSHAGVAAADATLDRTAQPRPAAQSTPVAAGSTPVPCQGGSGTPEAGGGTVASVSLRPRRGAPVAVLTGPMGAQVIGPLLDGLGRTDVRLVCVDNQFFGGNVGVTGLMVGQDLCRTLALEPHGHRYLLPDVCLSRGVFLDGLTVDDLPRPVEIVPTDGASLRRALDVPALVPA